MWLPPSIKVRFPRESWIFGRSIILQRPMSMHHSFRDKSCMLGRITSNQAPGFNTSGHDRTRSNKRAFPNGKAWQNNCASAYRGTILYNGRKILLWIVFTAREEIVCKSDIRTNEHVIPDT